MRRVGSVLLEMGSFETAGQSEKVLIFVNDCFVGKQDVLGLVLLFYFY